jgi:predicted Zn-dependent protease
MTLFVKGIIGQKIGQIETTSLENIDETLKTLEKITNLQKPNPDFTSLSESKPHKKIKTFYKKTAGYTPEQRAEDVKTLVERAHEERVTAVSGAFSTTFSRFQIATSLGIEKEMESTLASVSATAMSDTGFGYADHVSRNVDELDFTALGTEAAERCVMSEHPQSIPPGEYEVVLDEYAVGTMIIYLAFMGFSAMDYQEQRSFMCGSMGNAITGDRITIWDDGLDERTVSVPFDFEGVPKRKVPLITNGVAENVVHNTYTAGKEGKESTGHALLGTEKPYPSNLFLKGGDSTRGEMIEETAKGLLITRFHYVNPLHPIKTIITGMTRDGTFLVENGEITAAVKNLRFTQSILDALKTAELIGKETKLERVSWLGGGVRVPKMKLGSFRFTGATEF